jgi:hypothetical protein
MIMELNRRGRNNLCQHLLLIVLLEFAVLIQILPQYSHDQAQEYCGLSREKNISIQILV